MKKISIFVFLAFVFLSFSFSQTNFVYNFDNLSIPDTGFWNGSDTSIYSNGYFGDDLIQFENNYNFDFYSWDGFAFCNWTDTTTEGYANQWSTYAGNALSGEIFGLAYISLKWWDDNSTIPVNINFSQPVKIDSFFITNSTYTALNIKNGSPNEPFSLDSSDFYKIIIYCINQTDTIDTLEIFLADYTGNEPIIVKNWQKVDLTNSDSVTSLAFDAVTTDIGMFGANTPLYFCIEDLYYKISPEKIKNTENTDFVIFPNPATNYIQTNLNITEYQIFDISGKLIISEKTDAVNSVINIENLKQGTYLLRVKTNENVENAKFIKL